MKISNISADVLDHYLKYGLYTYPGLYIDEIRKLPDDLTQLGKLVRSQIIHHVILKNFEIASDQEILDGVKTKLPWYRQAEDAIFPTAASMLAELYRRDSRGLVEDRAVKDRLILTCRSVSILTASILKSKGIPARVRSGFAAYLPDYDSKYVDHWVNQYWDNRKNSWITIDIDGSSVISGFDPFNMPEQSFCFSADAWINTRKGMFDADDFWNAKGDTGLIYIAWELFYDFHCLMNNEIIYPHHPTITMPDVFNRLTNQELEEIDDLAEALRKPDENFSILGEIWRSNKKFRLLKGMLLYNS